MYELSRRGVEVFGDDTIIFNYADGTTQYSVSYPNMDALIRSAHCFGNTIEFMKLVSVKGNFDSDRYFNYKGIRSGEGIEHNITDLHFWEYSNTCDIDINLPVWTDRNCRVWGYTPVESVFGYSTYNKPLDKFLDHDSMVNVGIPAWFIGSEFNQPLNNWGPKIGQNIEHAFRCSKYNHPLDKWFQEDTIVNAKSTFAESEFYQDLSMWRINPKSECSGMFYNSRYTIEEVSKWEWVKALNQPTEDIFKLTEGPY